MHELGDGRSFEINAQSLEVKDNSLNSSRLLIVTVRKLKFLLASQCCVEAPLHPVVVFSQQNQHSAEAGMDSLRNIVASLRAGTVHLCVVHALQVGEVLLRAREAQVLKHKGLLVLRRLRIFCTCEWLTQLDIEELLRHILTLIRALLDKTQV